MMGAEKFLAVGLTVATMGYDEQIFMLGALIDSTAAGADKSIDEIIYEVKKVIADVNREEVTD